MSDEALTGRHGEIIRALVTTEQKLQADMFNIILKGLLMEPYWMECNNFFFFINPFYVGRCLNFLRLDVCGSSKFNNLSNFKFLIIIN